MNAQEILNNAKFKLSNMEADPADYWEDECYKAYDQMLDDCMTCDTCGQGGADTLKENDPTAYDCGFADWIDADGKEFAKRQDEYKELEEAIEEAEDKLSELEDLL